MKNKFRLIKFAALLAVLTLSTQHLLLSTSEAAVGDKLVWKASVAAGATLSCQPSSGVEAVIHAIWHEDDIEIQTYDGTTAIAAVNHLGADIFFPGGIMRVSNAEYVRVKNLHASAAKNIKCEAIITK